VSGNIAFFPGECLRDSAIGLLFRGPSKESVHFFPFAEMVEIVSEKALLLYRKSCKQYY
jgi:hypothetical protein